MTADEAKDWGGLVDKVVENRSSLVGGSEGDSEKDKD